MFLREPSHILILLIVVLVLFGAKRLPDSARSLGRSMRIFKSEMKEMTAEEKKDDGETPTDK
jgi:TatA/E family protein of Tat protein translocase